MVIKAFIYRLQHRSPEAYRLERSHYHMLVQNRSSQELKAPQLQKKENKCQEVAGYVIKANMYVLEK